MEQCVITWMDSKRSPNTIKGSGFNVTTSTRLNDVLKINYEDEEGRACELHLPSNSYLSISIKRAKGSPSG